jgi:iron complex outermembrane receptor protein
VDVKYRDAYLNNVTLNDKTYFDSIENFRGQLLWNAADDVTVLFSADFTHDSSSGKIVQLSGNLAPELFPTLSYNPYNTNQGQNTTTDKNILGLSARVNWSLPWGTLTSISGFRDVRDVTPGISRVGDPDNQALATFSIRDKQYTQELRIAGPGTERLTWLTGLFYLHADKGEVDGYTNSLNPGTVNGGSFPVPIIGVSQNVGQAVVDQSGAAFGEVTYEIVDNLRATFGGRAQWEQKSGTSTVVADFAPGNPYDAIYPLIFANASAGYSDTWRSFTPKGMVSYQATDGLMMYVSATKGYKSGGWDTSAASDYGKSGQVIAQQLATPFQPEKVWSYELGGKYLSEDRRLQVNAAAFLADYSDMQTSQFNPQTGVFQTTNVGKARARGIELETTEAPMQWLTLGLNYTYELARYTSYVQGDGTNYTGNTIPLTPKHNVHATVDADFGVPGVSGTFDIGADYTYRTVVHFLDSNAEPAFLLNQSKFDGIVNMHTTWKSDDDLWHVSLFATNLTNRHTIVFGNDVSGFLLTPAEAANSANAVYSVVRIPTRVFGLTIRRNF